MASTFVNPPRGGTMVNQYGRNGVSTDINPPVSAGIASSTSLDLEPGAILPDDYSVIRRIGNAADSGEADVFLCEKTGGSSLPRCSAGRCTSSRNSLISYPPSARSMLRGCITMAKSMAGTSRYMTISGAAASRTR